MSLEEGLFDHLATTLSVGDRIYPLRLPGDAVLQALTYQLIPSDGPLYSQDGDTGTMTVRVQLGCWGATYDDAVALWAELHSVLSGYRGALGDVVVGHCLLAGPLDDVDEETGAHRRITDAVIQYQEAGS